MLEGPSSARCLYRDMRHLHGFLSAALSGEGGTELQSPGFITTSRSLREEKVLPRKTLILSVHVFGAPGLPPWVLTGDVKHTQTDVPIPGIYLHVFMF